jgi:hypothetical protein
MGKHGTRQPAGIAQGSRQCNHVLMIGESSGNEVRGILDELVPTLVSAHTVAIVLAGSIVQGNATPFSDIDLAHIIDADYTGFEKQFYYRAGRLVSVNARTLDWWQRAVIQPEKAIFVVPAMQRAHIVLDPTGAFAHYQANLAEFSWQPLQQAAHQFAGATLASQAETVHKILSGLVRGEGLYEPTVVLTLDLTLVMAVHGGVLVESASSYMRQVRQTMGNDSTWSSYHRVATSDRHGGEAPSTLQQQAQAAIHLYRETFRLIESTMAPDRRDLAGATVDVIDILGQRVI